MPYRVKRTMPSAWQIHLTKFRSAHPNLSLKEAMQGASKSYRGAAKTAPAPKKATAKATAKATKATKITKATTYRSAQNGNPWLAHVQAYRASHPGITYSEALKAASKTYTANSDGTLNTQILNPGDFYQIRSFTAVKFTVTKQSKVALVVQAFTDGRKKQKDFILKRHKRIEEYILEYKKGNETITVHLGQPDGINLQQPRPYTTKTKYGEEWIYVQDKNTMKDFYIKYPFKNGTDRFYHPPSSGEGPSSLREGQKVEIIGSNLSNHLSMNSIWIVNEISQHGVNFRSPIDDFVTPQFTRLQDLEGAIQILD